MSHSFLYRSFNWSGAAALLLLCFLVAGCSSGSDREKKKQNAVEERSSKKEAENKKPDKPEKPQKLTPENAEDFLREYGKTIPHNRVKIKTRMGDIVIELFQNTPVHRANFLYLTDLGYFDMTEFYRVSPGFVCQAGNSDEYETQYRRSEIGKYTLTPEFRDEYFNRHGSVAMARQYKDNPDKRSSCYEFFINVGRPQNNAEIQNAEEKYGITYTEEQKEIYRTEGGNPHLDVDHTVFGKVVQGMDVVEEINRVEVDNREWPNESIPVEVEIIKE